MILMVCILTLFASACSGSSTPQMIASYPKNVADYPPPPVPARIVYDASLTVEVTNPEKSADRAADLTYQHDGYLSNSQSWYQEGKACVTVVLAVPTINFDELLWHLRDLGTVLSDEVTSRLSYDPPSGWTEYSQITVKFILRTVYKPSIHTSSWRPLRTLERALGVSLSILGFLVDVVIWVVVVLGPLVCLVWIGVKLTKRTKKV